MFDRVRWRRPNSAINSVIDEEDDAVLSCVDPEEQYLPTQRVMDVLKDDGRITELKYDKTDVSLESSLALNDTFQVKNDSEYGKSLLLNYPVNRLGNPRIYLQMMRMVCTNGMIARSTAFSTDLAIDHQHGDHLRNVLNSFNNAEGFERIHSRIAAAQETKASMDEVYAVNNLMERIVPASRKDECQSFADRLNVSLLSVTKSAIEKGNLNVSAMTLI